MLFPHEVQNLKHGQMLHHITERNADGTPQRWRVSGRVRLTCQGRKVRVPLKHGWRTYGAIESYREAFNFCLDPMEALSTTRMDLPLETLGGTWRRTERRMLRAGAVVLELRWWSYLLRVGLTAEASAYPEVARPALVVASADFGDEALIPPEVLEYISADLKQTEQQLRSAVKPLTPKMGLKAWLQRYYPESGACAAKAGRALEHTIRKWEGARPEVLAEYGLNRSCSTLSDNVGERFSFNAATCAFCFPNMPCESCPLSKALGDRRCFDVDQPYAVWSREEGGDADPMLEVLYRMREQAAEAAQASAHAEDEGVKTP